MPILYIHGVNTRTRDTFLNEIQVYLRRYVAPVISTQPDSVSIEDVYWGGEGVKFVWDGASRPRSRLLGQGADAVAAVSPIEQALMANLLTQRTKEWPAGTTPATGGLLPGGPSATSPTSQKLDLSQLSSAALSDFAGGIINSTVPTEKERVAYRIAADEAAHDPSVLDQIKQESNPDRQVEVLFNAAQSRVSQPGGLLGQGVGEWFTKIRDRGRETVQRATSFPAYTASIFAAEARKPLNELVSFFLGDVLEYITRRKSPTEPGTIPGLMLAGLKKAHANKVARNNEPLIVLSHSMGGQIVYDAVSYFLPADPQFASIKIDFWCATASQVGFFEEAKFLLASNNRHLPGHPVPFPDKHLRNWWNLWDQNDFISFTTKEIFMGVDDEEFDSGMSLINAHSGYLQRPSFYRRFADKLQTAKARGWRNV